MMPWLRCFFLAVCFVILAGCGGKEDRIIEHLQKGKDSFFAENYEKARVELKNVLQIDPKHIEAHTFMGRTMEKLENFQAAGSHYSKVIELDSGQLDARSRLARLYFMGRNIPKAKEHVDGVLSVDPHYANALTVRAGILAGEKNTESAVEHAERALRIDPNQLEATYLLAALYKETQGEEVAIRFIEDALNRHGAEISLRLILGSLYMDKERFSDAESVMQEVISLEPQVLNHYVRLAKFYASRKNHSQGEGALKSAINVLQDNVRAKIALSEYFYSQERAQEAKDSLLSYIQESPKEYDLSFALAALHIRDESTEQAIEIYKNVIELDQDAPNGLKARIHLAKIYLKQQDEVSAKQMVDQVLTVNERDQEGLFIRAGLALKANDSERAIADYRTILRDSPNSFGVQENLAKAYIQNGQAKLAIDSLKKLTKLNPGHIPTRLLLANLYMNEGQANEVLSHASQVLAIEENNLPALEYAARASISNKDWLNAEKFSGLLIRHAEKQSVGYFLAGITYTGLGDVERGRTELAKALEISPNAVEPLNLLVRSHLSEGNDKKALSVIDDVLKGSQNHAVAHNLKAEILMKNKRFSQAKTSLQKAIQLSPAYHVPYINLSDLHLAEKDLVKAKAILMDGLKSIPHDGLVFKLALLHMADKEIDQASALYEQVLEKTPDSKPAMNNLAMLLATYKADDKTSLDKAMKLSKPLRNSSNPAYLDTVGYVHSQREEYLQAIPMFQQALIKVPDSGLLRYRLGHAQYQSGMKEDAKRNLQAALDSEQEFSEREKAISMLASLEQEPLADY